MDSGYLRPLMLAVLFSLVIGVPSYAKQVVPDKKDTEKINNNTKQLSRQAEARDPNYRSPSSSDRCGSYPDLVISTIEHKPISGGGFWMKVSVNNRCETAARNVQITFWSNSGMTSRIVPPISSTIAGKTTAQTGWIGVPGNSSGSTTLWAEVTSSNERNHSGNKKSKRVP